jgi:hypothetical protein
VEGASHGWPATWLGRPANTWQITDLIKLVIAPGTPIMSYPISKRVELKPPSVYPGCSNHTYSNNMIIR